MKFVLLLGFLSLGACAVFVTASLRSLHRKAPSFPLPDTSNVVPFSPRRSSPQSIQPPPIIESLASRPVRRLRFDRD
jgi:hypothetical protein